MYLYIYTNIYIYYILVFSQTPECNTYNNLDFVHIYFISFKFLEPWTLFRTNRKLLNISWIHYLQKIVFSWSVLKTIIFSSLREGIYSTLENMYMCDWVRINTGAKICISLLDIFLLSIAFSVSCPPSNSLVYNCSPNINKILFSTNQLLFSRLQMLCFC